MNVLDLAEKHVDLKRMASTKGGEYAGPCPGCGGDDRFRVWPAEKDGEGSWWCRGCNKSGDVIQFLIEFEGKTFPQACEALHKPMPDARRFHSFHSKQKHKSDWDPVRVKAPEGVNKNLWSQKAQKFAEWAHKKLLKNEEQLSYLAGRGIDKDTAIHFKLGYNPGSKNNSAIFRPRESWGLQPEIKEDGTLKKLWIPRGIVIPCFSGDEILRIRIRRPGSDLTPKFNTKYYVVPGSTMAPMLISSDKKAIVVVETELDACMLHQVAGDIVGVLAMGSAAAKPDSDAYNALQKSLCILNGLDFDRAGYHAGQWWYDHFQQVTWWPVPDGKDPGDAYEKGVDLRKWILAGLPPAWHVGPFSLNGGDKGAPTPVEVLSKDASKKQLLRKPEVEGPLEELYGYLKKYPIKIMATKTRLSLIEKPGYYTWETGQRVSQLVFFNDEVFDYLHRHPDDIVSCDNFWKEK